MTREEAVREVAHLTRLDHAHILRVIRNYTKGRHLSILPYPMADYNLEDFLEVCRTSLIDHDHWSSNYVPSVGQMFVCQSSAVEYIHRNLTKHMDIKPQNVLVRNVKTRNPPFHQSRRTSFKAYIADFGIARSFNSSEAVDTE
jgi:serine/threonine protein kinase